MPGLTRKCKRAAPSGAPIRSVAQNCHRRNSFPPLNDTMVRDGFAFEVQMKRRSPFGLRLFIWSCWADSNRRPHPYQAIFAGFYNNFRLFSVVFIPNNIVSRTFLKRRLRCFHACLWWNCGQATICANDVCTNLISAAQRRTPAIPCDFPSSFRAIFLFACNRYY